MKLLKKYYLNTKAYVLYAIALVISIGYGLFSSPFLLHFIDGLTIISVVYLFVGVLGWAKDAGINIVTNYKDIKEAKAHKRKDAEISLYIPVGLFLFFLSFLISVFLY